MELIKDKRTQNAHERTRTIGGVPILAILTVEEEEALLLTGEDGGWSVADGEAGAPGQEGESQLLPGYVPRGHPTTFEEEQGTSEAAAIHPFPTPSISSDTSHLGWAHSAFRFVVTTWY
ncbi:uncharacterized protein [Heterodontus francisci]|uniref:uncharacterized protein isoform X2 n=1 Tax=Heterodontus francisci TaxID=7792 RepID=UPI00355B63DC